MRRTRSNQPLRSVARRVVSLILLAAIGCVPDAWTFPSRPDASLDVTDVVASDTRDGATEPPPCDEACKTRCARGLVALYRGDGDARDALGNHHGTASRSVTWVDGRFGQAFNIDGAPDYVSVPSEVTDFEGDFTITFWFSTLRGGEMVTRRPSCWGITPTIGEDMGTAPDGTFASEVFSTGDYVVVRARGTFNDGDWHNASLVRRGETVELWVEGVMRDAHATTGDFIDPHHSPTYLGVGRCVAGAPGSNGTADPRQWYRGALDNVAFYNRALSPAELVDWAEGRCAP